MSTISHVMWLKVYTEGANNYWDFWEKNSVLSTWFGYFLIFRLTLYIFHIFMTSRFDPKLPHFCKNCLCWNWLINKMYKHAFFWIKSMTNVSVLLFQNSWSWIKLEYIFNSLIGLLIAICNSVNALHLISSFYVFVFLMRGPGFLGKTSHLWS